jgi:peptidyl-prolyl cis-trans isomerase A (cyclophilin A)
MIPRFLVTRALAVASLLGAPIIARAQPGIVRLTMQTEFGDIELAIDSAHAPITATNFLRYVDAGRYAGGRFHRTVRLANQQSNPIKIDVIQWSAAVTSVEFPPIILERTNQTGLKHLDGTISMARAGANTATSDVFICIGDQPELDFDGKRNADGLGFAAFGRVTRGMDVVRRIHDSPAMGQTLDPPIRIVNIVRVR